MTNRTVSFAVKLCLPPRTDRLTVPTILFSWKSSCPRWRVSFCGVWRDCTDCLQTIISSPSADKPLRTWKRSSAAATMSLSFCNRRDISASRLTAKQAPRLCTKPTSCGARTMCENPCRQTGSVPSLHRTSVFTMWKPPTTSTPEERECVDLSVSRCWQRHLF